MTTRNAIFDALLALGAGLPLGFTETGRRIKEWDACQKPALFQVEPDEKNQTPDARLRIRTLHATWVIYHDVGQDPNSVPTRTTANILDAIDLLFPVNVGLEKQTLGGLVHSACVDGVVRKFEGDLDGKTIITVPIALIVP